MQLKELLNVNWNFLFSHKNVHEQVVIVNQTLMNIFSNYILNKLITVDDKDPPWVNEYIKRKILDKKIACKSFNTNYKNDDAYLKLQTISIELSETILKRKNDYHRQPSDKLNDPKTCAKVSWSILKTLNNGKKIPFIPPILVNKKTISNLRRKQTISMISTHLNVLQSLMIVLYPIQPILFFMLVYHPVNSKINIFLRLYAPLTTTKLMVMMIYL